jgi:hypothetical protein
MNYRQPTIDAAVSHAPAWVRRAINARRVELGLEPVLAAAELQAVYQAADQALAAARARATRDAAGVIRAAGQAAASSGASPRATPTAAATITRVLLAVGYGLARCKADGLVCGEWMARGAFGTPAELNSGRCWSLVDGHRGPMIATVGSRLRAIRSRHVPLMIEWIPQLTLPEHIEIVARIEAGHTGVSAESIKWSCRTTRLPEPTRVVDRAGLIHVALLTRPEEPAFPGARALVFRDRPDTADELRRQVAEAEGTAMRCSGAAEAMFQRGRRRG